MEKPDLPQRRPNRLPSFDYAQNGVYFLTICTKEKACILSHVSVGAVIGRPPAIRLFPLGEAVEKALQEIPLHYEDVFVDHYVIMPNHVHLLLRIQTENGRQTVAPSVQQIVNQFKGAVTKYAGKAVWQKSFYDHIVRDDYDYQIKWQYIDENPERWCKKPNEGGFEAE